MSYASSQENLRGQLSTTSENVEVAQVAEALAAKPITLLRLRDCFTWISISLPPATVQTDIAYMLYEGPLQNIFLYITSSILLIAFMSLYFCILFLSIIILCRAVRDKV